MVDSNGSYKRILAILLSLLLITAIKASSSSNSFLRPRLLCLRGGNEKGDDVDLYSENTFHVLNETLIYSNWRTVISRKVKFPSGQIVDFEVIGQRGNDQAVAIVAWDSQKQRITIVQEYMPSLGRRSWGLPAGMVDYKHESPLAAARAELAEEARLREGTWYELCTPTCMDKYSTTRISVYLVVDPHEIPEGEGPERDAAEEGLEVLETTVDQLETAIRDGRLSVTSGWAAQLGLSKLRELREI